MSDREQPRPTSVVTRDGLEITAPTREVQGTLVGFFVLLVIVIPVFITFYNQSRAHGIEDWLHLLDGLFGWTWLGAGLLLAILTVSFSHRSNVRCLIGPRVILREGRVGRIVLSSDSWRRPKAVRVDTGSDVGERSYLRIRGGRWYSPETRISGLHTEDAERLAAQVRSWLEAPEEAPVEEAESGSMGIAAAETALSIVSSRLSMVFPLLIATVSLLLLVIVWQLHQAQGGHGVPLPRMDLVAEGELIEHRWVIHAPFGEHGPNDPRAYLRLGVAYVPEDGVSRTLWLRTRHAPPLSGIRREMGITSAMVGLPSLEFQLPTWMAEVTASGEGWAEWRAIGEDPAASFRSRHAAELLAPLDDPFDNLLRSWTAPVADWRIAYNGEVPERAMPLQWAEAERLAMEQLNMRDLLVPGGVALLLVLLTLPGIFSFGSRRSIGRLLAVAVVLAIPWWAEHAEAGVSRLAAGGWALDFAYDRLRNTLPEESRRHAVLQRTRAPSAAAPGSPIAWSPERSESAELLRTLDLMTPPTGLPLPHFDAVADAMRTRARSALLAMTPEELLAFAEMYEAADHRTARRTLHRVVVMPSLCAVIDGPPLSPDLHRRLEYVRTGGPMGDVEPCGANSGR